MSAKHTTWRQDAADSLPPLAAAAIAELARLYPHPVSTCNFQPSWHGSGAVRLATLEREPTSGSLRTLIRRGLVISAPDPATQVRHTAKPGGRRVLTNTPPNKMAFSLTVAGLILGRQLIAQRHREQLIQNVAATVQKAATPYAIPAPRTGYGSGVYTGEHLTRPPARAGAMAAYALPSRGIGA